MSLSDLLPHELMQIVADFFESRGVDYRVVGSMASMLYGEPRFTNDVDIVAQLQIADLPALCVAFPSPEYYLSETAAQDAIIKRFQFNILHPSSGLKVDVIIPPDNEFSRSAAQRIRRFANVGDKSVCFASPEDVLLNKLIYFQLSGGVSDKHLRDIAGMMKLLRQELDRDYITEWATKLGLTAEWQLIQQRVDS
jgi:hypothetical protein